MNQKRQRWSDDEVSLLKEFIIEQKSDLIKNFYMNILSGDFGYRKMSKFFPEMSKKIGRNPDQCKSKFQKFEEKIYIDYLNINPNHFKVFIYLRTKKIKLKNQILKNELEKKEPDSLTVLFILCFKFKGFSQ